MDSSIGGSGCGHPRTGTITGSVTTAGAQPLPRAIEAISDTAARLIVDNSGLRRGRFNFGAGFPQDGLPFLRRPRRLRLALEAGFGNAGLGRKLAFEHFPRPFPAGVRFERRGKAPGGGGVGGAFGFKLAPEGTEAEHGQRHGDRKNTRGDQSQRHDPVPHPART